MMTTLFAVSVLALAVLAVWFVAVLAIRLFTKRRPPLCTRITAAVAAVAVGIIALGQAGLSAEYYRQRSIIKILGESIGEDQHVVEKHLGPGRRYPDSHTSVSMVLPDYATNGIVEVWVYDTGVWYSWYRPANRVLACFDENGRLVRWILDF